VFFTTVCHVILCYTKYVKGNSILAVTRTEIVLGTDDVVLTGIAIFIEVTIFMLLVTYAFQLR